MAGIYPFSQKTVGRLSSPPTAGETHRWLAQAASGVAHLMPAEKCFAFLRQCCDLHVAHRQVPDREIAAAVELAYGGGTASTGQVNFGRKALDWPEANPELIARTLERVEPVFDGETSTGLSPADVLPALFRPGELVCTGADSDRAVVRPVEAAVADAHEAQFICVNPMRAMVAMNQAGRPSARCQNNVKARRYLVAEFDDASITKRQQAQLATALGGAAPLVMAVDSGGKSLHAWFDVESMTRQDQARFFAVACLLGADRTRWDLCGWLRMPGGLRAATEGRRVRQKILYWDPHAIWASGDF